MTEAEIISTLFAFSNPKQPEKGILQGIGDDAAILKIPQNQTLITCVDTFALGVHAPVDTSAADFAYKAVASCLSDIAAMGAKPCWALLALSHPSGDLHWLKTFSAELQLILQRYDIALIGGDLSKGPLTANVHILGLSTNPQHMCRHMAQEGDDIYVSGTLGRAAAGLACRQSLPPRVSFSTATSKKLTAALFRPEPRISLGQALAPLAHAAIDLSDGLLKDLNTLLQASKAGATVNLENIPIDPCLANIPENIRQQWGLTGGDDYELLFTAARSTAKDIQAISNKLQCPLTRIGTINTSQKLDIPGLNMADFTKQGHEHFS
jgi:thiamine-monophosphate kinase